VGWSWRTGYGLDWAGQHRRGNREGVPRRRPFFLGGGGRVKSIFDPSSDEFPIDFAQAIAAKKKKFFR
jgi:hypothetical protein